MTEVAAAPPLPRFQFRIQWLMVVVAVAAVVMAVPFLQAVIVLGSIPAILTASSAVLAPHGRRFLVAYWTGALHPLAIMAWLMLVRSTRCRRPLGPRDGGWTLSWTLEIPYIAIVFANLFILPPLWFAAILSEQNRRDPPARSIHFRSLKTCGHHTPRLDR